MLTVTIVCLIFPLVAIADIEVQENILPILFPEAPSTEDPLNFSGETPINLPATSQPIPQPLENKTNPSSIFPNRTTPLRPVQLENGVLESFKGEVRNLLNHLQSKVHEAIAMVNKTANLSKFEDFSRKVHEEALEVLNKEFDRVHAEIERLKSECRHFPHMIICLMKHEKDFEHFVRYTKEALHDLIDGEVQTFAALIAENWRKFDLSGLMKRLEELVENVHDMKSLFDAVRLIIENLDLPTKIIRSVGGFIIDTGEEFCLSLRREVAKTIVDVKNQTHTITAKLKQCFKS